MLHKIFFKTHNEDASAVKYRTRLSMSFSFHYSITDRFIIVNLLVLPNVTVIKSAPSVLWSKWNCLSFWRQWKIFIYNWDCTFIHSAVTKKSELILIRGEKFSANKCDEGDSFAKWKLANNVNTNEYVKSRRQKKKKFVLQVKGML